MALSRFLCCERSFWHCTTMPVGKCVMRTAESVMLTCWPPAPPDAERIDAQIVRLDVDFDLVVDLRVDENRGERRVAARVGVERRDAHQAVHADLGLQQAVGVLAVDFESDGLDARAFALQPVGDHGLEAVALRPAQVHAQQHFGPVLAFGAAGAGMDGHDGAARASFSPESSMAVSRRSTKLRVGF